MKALTVLVPAFNEEATILRCLDSLLSQNVNGLEILVLDDGSTDATVSLVKTHPNFGKNLGIVESKVHIGAQLNLLRGALCVATDLTFFMSANDVLIDGSLERLVSHMEANGNCVSCYGRSTNIDDEGRVIGETPAHFYVNARSSSWQERCLSVAAQYVWGGVQYALYRTEALQIAYPHEARYGADHLFYFLLASAGEIHFLEDFPMRLEKTAPKDSSLASSIEKHKNWYRKAKGDHISSSVDFDYDIEFPFISMIMSHYMAFSKMMRSKQLNQSDIQKSLSRLIDIFCRRFSYIINHEIEKISSIKNQNQRIFSSRLSELDLNHAHVQQYLVMMKYIDFSHIISKRLNAALQK